MLLSVVHRTTFEYSEEIFDTAMEMRLRPRDDAGQRCAAYALLVDPAGPVRSYDDAFGNRVDTYNYRALHRRIVVEARSAVWTGAEAAPPIEGALPISERIRFLRLEGPVTDCQPVREMAASVAGSASGARTPAALAAAAAFVHGNFVYEQNVTRVDSTVRDLLELGRGVCQDFAHLWIGICRAMGIPARYVSGYIWNGDDRQEQASHAWGEAWLPEHGWLGYDPTNLTPENGGRVGEQHVRVAVGRDYRDVPPTRGVYRGVASETLAVEVRVEKLAPESLAGMQRSLGAAAQRGA